VHPHLPAAPAISHRTTTFSTRHHPVWPHTELPTGPRWTHATCRCGWAECAESRHDARVLARHHRRFATRTSVFHPGWASRIGPREHNGDAVGVHVSITGQEQAWALAAATGDDTASAYAAGHAATTAAYVAAHHGSTAGLLAAADTVCGLDGADTSLIVATVRPETDRGGWDIAWAGTSRAYANDPETDLLRKLTVDHTQGDLFRQVFAPHFEDRPRVLEKVATFHDRYVYTTVGTVTPTTVGRTTMYRPRRRLPLTTGGLHHTVPEHTMATIAQTFPDAEVSVGGQYQ